MVRKQLGICECPTPPHLPQHDLQAEALAALGVGHDDLLFHLFLSDVLHVQAQDSQVQCRGVDVEPGEGFEPD